MELEPEFNFIDYWFGVRRVEIAGFRVRSNRPGLLTVDRSGVYSTARCRYIRKSRYHRYRALVADLGPLVKAYRSLHKLGMSSWPEYDQGARREIMLWKHKLMDAYWDAAPEKRKASAIERYLRARFQRGIVYPILSLGVAVIVGGGLLQLMMLGRFMVDFYELLLLLAFCLVSCFVLVMTERHVTVRWALSRSEIHDVLESELGN